MKKTLLKAFAFIAIICLVDTNLTAQNVGINATGAAPDGGAMLDISATNKGLLIPRVNIANLGTIAPITGSATTSMLVYNTNGTTGQGFYYWDGAQWVQFFAGNIPADNGLYFNAGASRVRLGGALVENTTITQAGFSMDVNLSGTGDFTVQDAGTDIFQIRDDGIAFFGDDVYWRDGNVGGTNLMRLIDDGNDGRLDIYENGAISVSLDANTQFVFNEQGLDRNFRIESDARTNMFFIDAGTNSIGINNGAPGNMLHFTSDGRTGWVTLWQNTTAAGGLKQVYNSSTANGSRVFMGVTNYSASALQAAAVMGLSLNNTTIGSGGVGVLGSANNESGNAVEGSLFTSGGYTGWAGYFNADVFSAGNYFGSDRRLKKDIKEYEGALNTIAKINPVTYYYDTDKYPSIGFDEGRLQYGFIAQEIENVIPEMVKDKKLILNSNTEKSVETEFEQQTDIFKVVNYSTMIPILTQGIKEQQEIINQQNKKIEALEKIVLELQEKMNK